MLLVYLFICAYHPLGPFLQTMQLGSFPALTAREAEKFTISSAGRDHSWWEWGEGHMETGE